MLKKLTESWASFPPLHKKRAYQALAAYVLVVLSLSAWIFTQADSAAKDWESRIPQADAPIKSVYLTPQLTDVQGVSFDDPALATASAIEGHVSIIMSDIGLSDSMTARALDDLPLPIALAASPYGDNLDNLLEAARETNRDVLALLPMEPETYPKDDPGPKALLTRYSEDQNVKNLLAILSLSKGATGAMNFMGSRFLADQKNLYPVFNTLQQRNLLFVEAPGSVRSAASEIAVLNNLDYMTADMRIDEKAGEAAIRQQLLELEKIARQRGYAIGIAHPYPVTFNVVKAWADTLENRGIRLSSLRTVLDIQKQKKETAEQEQQP